EVLVTLGEEFRSSVPALRQCLSDNAPGVRLHVARALWRFTGHTNETLPVLAALLSDRDPQIAAGAASALGEMGRKHGPPCPRSRRLCAAMIGRSARLPPRPLNGSPAWNGFRLRSS